MPRTTANYHAKGACCTTLVRFTEVVLGFTLFSIGRSEGFVFWLRGLPSHALKEH
jgi:hypothetical protein